MEIHYKLEKDDYLHFNLKQMANNEKIKRTMGMQVLIPFFIFLALGLWFWLRGQMTTGRLVFFLVFLVAWPILYVRFFKYSVGKRLRKIIDKKAPELNLGDRSLYLDEKGIKDTYGSLPFSHLHHIEESRDYFFFHETIDAAYILPKRDLSQEELAYIHAILEKMKEEALSQPKSPED